MDYGHRRKAINVICKLLTAVADAVTAKSLKVNHGDIKLFPMPFTNSEGWMLRLQHSGRWIHYSTVLRFLSINIDLIHS